MTDEAWIELRCPDCEETWESAPGDLPSPGQTLTCDHCGASHPVAEFVLTRRGFEVLEAFHGG